jgi:hypothetical protein
MLQIPHAASRSPADASVAPAKDSNSTTGIRTRRSMAAIKRLATTLLAMIAFAVVVSAIVALKSWVWIPSLGR